MIMHLQGTVCQLNNIVKMVKCITQKKCQNLGMVTVFSTGQMEPIMKDNGFTIKQREMEHSGMLRVTFIEVILKMIWRMAKVNILILMGVSIKENLKMMYKKAMGRKSGLMVQSMLDHIKME